MEKVRLKFPNKMYGRERELEMLKNICDGLALGKNTDLLTGSCVGFLSGYSSVGKSALVSEFITQTQIKYGFSEKPTLILHTSGNYTELSTSSAPFSAII